MSDNFNLIWTTDLAADRVKEVVRSKASASGWKQRKRRGTKDESEKAAPALRMPAEASAAAAASAASKERKRQSTSPPVPAQVTVYEPQNRMFTTFLPRFKALLGPDSQDWIQHAASLAGESVVQEAFDCLIVGVCSNLRTSTELRASAIQRYGDILPKIQQRVNNSQQAKTLSTSSLIFLLGIEEAMVWKSFRNSQTHIAGWGRIVELRGPQSFTRGEDLFILRMFRMNAVAMHLLQRRPLFLSSDDWITIPWTYTRKNLFDCAYDLLVQLPGLIASGESFKKGNLPALEMHNAICSFVAQLNGWQDKYLFSTARAFTRITEWSFELVVQNILEGTLTDFTLARGLTHYLAAILLTSQFGPRYTAMLPLAPERAVGAMLAVVQKHALDVADGCLWPWIQPLRIAHFASVPNTFQSIVALCVRLERRFSWSILQSERYELFTKRAAAASPK